MEMVGGIDGGEIGERIGEIVHQRIPLPAGKRVMQTLSTAITSSNDTEHGRAKCIWQGESVSC